MYDALRTRYTFSCPGSGQASVALADFRELDRLPGATHPAVYRIRFACSCGEEHPGLVSHDELDWTPLGLGEGAFYNVMTARFDELAGELGRVAAERIGRGEWPWSFFCFPEERPRPIFPSAFCLIAPGTGREGVGLAVRCPVCGCVSVNLVSADHVNLPFHNDSQIGIVEHVFAEDRLSLLEEFTAELYSARFDARRLGL